MEEFFRTALNRITEASRRAAEKTEKKDVFSHIVTRETLIDMVGKKMKNRKLILVSNREPYAHVYKSGGISWFRSAGGLTVALDSVASAAGATWICHGDANADFRVTDEQGKLRVPPDQPRYTLKRIRLTKAEVAGYYEGFSNETLWPLCHVCYVRPKFNYQNWLIYQSVNRRFAEAVIAEAEPGSVVFLQDYHLCQVAKYVKEQRPDLTTVLFWHIPWPNPEIFRICPWKKELLEGLLSNDIIGFHLKYHLGNFAHTVDQELEAHIDWEKMRIRRQDRITRLNAYPISVDFNAIYDQSASSASHLANQAAITEYRLDGLKIGLGVDRLDYTKGILERLDALDRMFEKYPEHVGTFSYIQIGVPSRTHIEDYQSVVSRIESRCLEINETYGTNDWEPIKFLKGQLNFDTLVPFYKLADLCIVSSLHDGMNLVAKEFVAASSNDRGVLVLSQFTGAARELEQAFLINPYDTESFSETLHQALVMPREEQRTRLERMRLTVAENNIYTWAQAVLNDVIRLAEDSRIANGGEGK